MISAWTKHIKDEAQKEQFKNTILGSKPVLNRLHELLKEIEDDQDSIERNPKMYDSPNWDYRQAHLNGYKQALSTIKRIITLDQEEK